MQYPRTALLLAGLALVVGCGSDDDGVGPVPQASVRVVNAMPGSTPVDVTAGGATLAHRHSPTAHRAPVSSSRPARRPCRSAVRRQRGRHGERHLRHGRPVHGAGLRIRCDTASASLLTDSFSTPAAGNSALRFFNATGTAGDIYVTAPGGAVTGTPSSGNLAAGTATTTFSSFPNTDSQVRLFDVGTITSARGDVTLGALGATPARWCSCSRRPSPIRPASPWSRAPEAGVRRWGTDAVRGALCALQHKRASSRRVTAGARPFSHVAHVHPFTARCPES